MRMNQAGSPQAERRWVGGQVVGQVDPDPRDLQLGLPPVPAKIWLRRGCQASAVTLPGMPSLRTSCEREQHQIGEYRITDTQANTASNGKR